MTPGRRPLRERVSARVWLLLIVAGSTVSLVWLGLAVVHPVVFVDELVYTTAAERLALGRPPAVPGGEYGYGLGFPLLASAAYRLAADTADAYVVVKALDALVFSLAAVPAYLLARRGAGVGLSLAVAALTVLVPARIYAALATTESLAYLAFLVGVLAVARALERPTLARQAVALGAVLVAFEVRRQNVVLVGILVVGALVGAVSGPTPQATLRRLAPTFGIVLAGAAAVVLRGLAEGGASSVLGPYRVLVTGYSAGEVVGWALVHVGVLALSVAVVPIAALPFGLRAALRRDAPEPLRALGAVTAAAVPLVLVQVAAFASTPYGLERAHERNLFYVAPLVFALLAVWIERDLAGSPRAIATAAVGAALLCVLLATRERAPSGTDAPTLVALGLEVPGSTRGVAVLGFALLCSTFLALWVPLARRRPAVLLAVVAAAFVVVDVRAARALVDEGSVARADAVAGVDDGWIDRAVGRRADVSLLWVAPAASCADASAQRASAESRAQSAVFYATGISRVVSIGAPADVGLPTVRARIDGSRVVVPGRAAGLVLADDRVPLAGERLAARPDRRLALWRVGGELRLPPGETAASIRRRVC